MLTDWKNTIQKFVSKFKAAIWYPSGRQVYVKERKNWLQPLQIPKLHCILSHVPPFVRSYGFMGKLSQDSFEHFQQISQNNRELRASNIYTGVKIIEGIKYACL